MIIPDLPSQEMIYPDSRSGIIKSCSENNILHINYALNKVAESVYLNFRISQKWLIGDI